MGTLGVKWCMRVVGNHVGERGQEGMRGFSEVWVSRGGGEGRVPQGL